MAETLIIVSRRTPSTLRCAGFSPDFETEATGVPPPGFSPVLEEESE
jgi:hypothetical protein